MLIVVLVGTTKGRTTAVAEEVAARLGDAGATVDVVPMDRADAALVGRAEMLIVCTSTFGAGGVPANAADFLARVEAGDIPCAGRPIAYVGLGDRSFRHTYNGGWRTFERAFTAHGAVTLGEPLLFDAADALPPAEAAARRRDRIAAWVDDLRAVLPAAAHT